MPDPVRDLLCDRDAQPWVEPDPAFTERVLARVDAAPSSGFGVDVPTRSRWRLVASLAAASLVAGAAWFAFTGEVEPTPPPPSNALVALLESVEAELAARPAEAALTEEWAALTADARAVAENLSSLLPRRP